MGETATAIILFICSCGAAGTTLLIGAEKRKYFIDWANKFQD